MIMLMDACARMAKKLGKTDEADSYSARSKRLLDTLVNELYDGEQFVGYMTETGEYIKCQSLAMFQALVLGKERHPAAYY
jgi:putative alpha-1,2-mannosidase